MAKKKKIAPARFSFEEGIWRTISAFRSFVASARVETAGIDVPRCATLIEDSVCMTERVLEELGRERAVVARLREEIAELEGKVEDLECVNEEFADEILRVGKLAGQVLGREDLDEGLEKYELRRAVEDLARSVS